MYKNWDAGNKQTGAGSLVISSANADSGYRDETGGGRSVPSFNLSPLNALNADGTIKDNMQLATTFHGTPWHRKKTLYDGIGTNNNNTNGCINGKCTDLQDMYNDPNIGVGTHVYILSEDPDEGLFRVENNKLIFRGNLSNPYKPSEQKKLDEWRVDNPDKDIEEYSGMEAYESSKSNRGWYVDADGEEREGSGLNTDTANNLNYQPINITIDKEKIFNSESTYDDSTKQQELELTNNAIPFMQSLVNNKKNYMIKYGINGDAYNDIALIAAGIFGAESKFGDENSFLENTARAISKKLVSGQDTGPDPLYEAGLMETLKSVGMEQENPSLGWTQMQWPDQNGTEGARELHELLTAAGLKHEDLTDPTKSAEATMIYLIHAYKGQVSTNEKRSNKTGSTVDTEYNIFEDLPVVWNNSKDEAGEYNYPTMVNNYIPLINLTEFNIEGVDAENIGREVKTSGEYGSDLDRLGNIITDEDRTTKEKIIDTGSRVGRGAATLYSNIVEAVATSGYDMATDAYQGVKGLFGYKSGGEFNLKQQTRFYEDYINGDYKNTKSEKHAEKIFDKLNRIYYTDSKLNNMHQLDYMRQQRNKG